MKILRAAKGYLERSNDLLFQKQRTLTNNPRLLIFFGGDVQDWEEEMLKHKENHKYVKWSLEGTVRILSENWPESHIIVIRPSHLEHGTFSCFKNFVELTDSTGTPKFTRNYGGLYNLKLLINNLLKEENIAETSSKTLVAFSKGTVVLNQLLWEMSDNDVASRNIEFIKTIDSMWWLDGGHGGKKNTWITQANILESFSKRQIKAEVRVTPYQVFDNRRPWIGKEEGKFCQLLRQYDVAINRVLLYEDESASIEKHFEVIKHCRP